MIGRPPSSPLFPHPTLFRSQRLSNRGVVSGYPCGGTNPATGAAEPCDASSRPYFRVNNNVTRGQTSKIVAETFFPNCVIPGEDRKSTRLNSSHANISYAVFC